MRRKDKELTDTERIEQILTGALFCHVALCDHDRPYCVPMCLAYHDGKILLHSADAGRKIDILHTNPHVCIMVETGIQLITGEQPCEYGMAYESVMIEGTASFLRGPGKARALEQIAMQYAHETGAPYTKEQISGIAVIEVIITSCTGRRSGSVPS